MRAVPCSTPTAPPAAGSSSSTDRHVWATLNGRPGSIETYKEVPITTYISREDVKPIIDLPHVTIEQAAAALCEAVAQRGSDYVYPSRTCTYVSLNCPSCLVAEALSRLGVSVEQLQQLDNLGLDKVMIEQGGEHFGVDAFISELADWGFVNLRPEVLALFAEAQSLQDAHKTWGQAGAQAHVIITNQKEAA